MEGDTSYAGKYRTEHIYAGGIRFPEPERLAELMARLVDVFNKDVYHSEGTETGGKMDPFYLAADIAQDFVTIHPFFDGNGRMCRLLLNAYLIKYAGVVMNIGEAETKHTTTKGEGGRRFKEYMDIAVEATAGDTREEEEISRGKLARFVLERGTITLRGLRARLDA